MPLPVYEVFASERPARLLVLCNTKVKTKVDRQFSARDGALVMKNLMDILGVTKDDMKFMVNLTKKQIEDTFYEESQNKDLSKYGMLIVVMLSYGYTGHVYGSDYRVVIVDDLMENFRGTNCTAMVGKPKIFIVQACEGDLYEKKTLLFQADAGGTLPPRDVKVTIPSEADFLIMWSPIPGNVWWHEDQKQCSPFIDALSKCLKEFPGMEISKLMTRVTQKVCQELEQNAPAEFREGGHRLPYMVHMLTKELYFHTFTKTFTKAK